MDLKTVITQPMQIHNIKDDQTGYVYPVLYAKVSYMMLSPITDQVTINFDCHAEPDCSKMRVTTASASVTLDDNKTEDFMLTAWATLNANLVQADDVEPETEATLEVDVETEAETEAETEQ